MAESRPVRLECDGPLAVMVLDDPPLNLYGDHTYEALTACVEEVERSDARALVFRAEGKIFTGGVDVHLFQRAVDGGGSSQQTFGSLIDLVRRVEALPIPTLQLVHELCLTWGLELGLGFDLIWAAESARFGLVEERVGLTPAGGGVQRMVERAGPGRTREFVMTGRLYAASTMEEWGVINRVLPDAELLERGMEFAHKLGSGPTKAHAATKKIIRAYLEGGLNEADEATAGIASQLFETEDLKNAVRSFLTEGPGKATFAGK